MDEKFIVHNTWREEMDAKYLTGTMTPWAILQDPEVTDEQKLIYIVAWSAPMGREPEEVAQLLHKPLDVVQATYANLDIQIDE